MDRTPVYACSAGNHCLCAPEEQLPPMQLLWLQACPQYFWIELGADQDLDAECLQPGDTRAHSLGPFKHYWL